MAIICCVALRKIDDLRIGGLAEPAHTDLLEILEDHYGQSSTSIPSQLQASVWHEPVG
jgi:hypothetical protein